MEDQYSFKYVSSMQKGRLCWLDNFMSDISYAIGSHFYKNLETYIYKANGTILLNWTAFSFSVSWMMLPKFRLNRGNSPCWNLVIIAMKYPFIMFQNFW